ncbi:MAG TPA: hypothetical protein VKU35_00470 [Candidatus Limnocylindria bacterium]|nr:hypothetical protein [Candidatus Limnocylindria bacterium]
MAACSIPLHIENPEPSEPTALAAYRAHVADCLGCDPGASRHCHVGLVLHNRWARAQADQREGRR